jgi:hypothetical protein
MHGKLNQFELITGGKRSRRATGVRGRSPILDDIAASPGMAALDAAFDEYRRIDAAPSQAEECRTSSGADTGVKSEHAMRGMIADIAAQLAGLERQRQTLTSLLRKI